MIPAAYYVHKDGVNYGPESGENLRQLGIQGWLGPDDLVWREGEAEWRPAGQVFTFAIAAIAEEEPAADFDPTEGGFFVPAAVHLPVRMSWPWGSIGLAVLGHVALLLVALEWFRMHPINFSATEIPATQEPPLEVAMIPEAPPTPPPAPPLMPIPSMAPMPVTTPAPEIPVPVSPPLIPRPVHHKMAKPAVPRMIATPTPPEPPAAPADEGQPEYLANPKPAYPYAARQRHQEGTVLLLVTLDADGNPTSVEVEQSSGVAVLDDAARKKVAADWRFKPGQGSTVHVPVEFHLNE